jgi:Tfp pilus assembly protein PilF
VSLALLLAMLTARVSVAAPLGVPATAAASDSRVDLADPRARADAQASVVAGLVEAGMYREALVAISELRGRGEDPPGLVPLQARAMHATGLSSEALALLDAHVKHRRRDAVAHAVRGLILADLGRVTEAVAALRRAAKRLPDDPGIRNNLGVALLAAGAPADAESAFRAALARDPANLRARNNLGFALARQGKDDDALASFRAAGDEGAARYNLGVACELRGDVPSALLQYRASLVARPDDPATRTALARLLPPAPPAPAAALPTPDSPP